MRTAPGDANDRTTVERRDPLLGTILDRRFRIEHQLAAGGFGAIYRATDVLSDAEVALKVLLPQMARDQNVVARFRREGATLSNLRDPHTITAYELGEAPDGTLYIVMELLHGESLYQQFRASGPLPWRRVVHIARGVCSSLAEAHAAGVVHRDLKPANIHLERRGNDPDFVKVLDFGIAKIVQGSEYDRSELTQAGHMIGTVDYMSPEQMVGGEMTPRSDIYTLGIVIYEMIAGRTPFADAQTATAILAAVLTRTADPLSRHAQVPPALDAIVARCLARDAQHRFQDVGELDDALAAVVGGLARPSPPPPPALSTEPVTMAFMRAPSAAEFTGAHAPLSAEFTVPAAPALPDDAPRPPPAAAVEASLRSLPSGIMEVPVRPRPAELVDVRGRAPVASAPLRPTPAEIIGVPSRPPRPTPPVVTSAPRAEATSGFEDVLLTNDATRIDVRFSPSSQPVLDARGARYRLQDLQGPTPAYIAAAPNQPPDVSSASGQLVTPPPAPARGSQHVIDGDGWQPAPHGRAVLPPFDAARQAPLPPLVAPHGSSPGLGGSPVPSHSSQLGAQRVSSHEMPSYDMAAARSHDAFVRRIIWISLIAAVIVAILIATH